MKSIHAYVYYIEHDPKAYDNLIYNMDRIY